MNDMYEQFNGNGLSLHPKHSEVHGGLVSSTVWRLIKGSHLCVGLTPTSDNAENLSQYDSSC